MKTLSKIIGLLTLGAMSVSHAVDERDFSSAVAGANLLKIYYADYIAGYGFHPESLKGLGLQESYLETELVEHVDIDPVSGSIMIGLSPYFGQNEWIALNPTVVNYQFQSWDCQTTVSADLALASDCRGDVPFEYLTETLNADLFSDTLAEINSIKLNAEESYSINSVFPRSMEELGITPSWLDLAKVSNVVVMPYFNTLFFALEGVYGNNQWVSIRPRIRYGNVYSWSCKTTLPSNLVSALGCSPSVSNQDLYR